MSNLPEFGDLQYLDPQDVIFSYSTSGILRFTYKDKYCVIKADAGCCFPLKMPERYIWVKDSKNKELGLIKSINELELNSKEILKDYLYKRYYMPNIHGVNKLTEEFGLWYFDAETDRGPRSFVVKDPRQNIINLGKGRLLVIDVDGNRFNINDYTLLSADVVMMLDRLV
ncbi:MAG: DUF1854 domain-containing protein [Firmicutes bacterium]|nr:DUF1854 domain-containing protein [Bacillota bacterium]MDD4264612.1 DUF1854 domain-containing protein [Bacillota bacterium]MDD4692834.1 DUF1854 domain-containing protein [Bacillota bacterium]